MPNRLAGIRADKARSYSAIEKIAHLLRSDCGYGDTEPIDAHKFFEYQLGDITVEYKDQDLALQESLEPCDSEGLTHWDADTDKIFIALSESTYSMLVEGHVRASYTVAHEVGHAVLHTDQLVRLASLSQKSQAALHRDNRGDHPAYLDTEWQANAFAGALLMPAAGIRTLQASGFTISATSLAKRYRVSTQAAEYRLESYEKV